MNFLPRLLPAVLLLTTLCVGPVEAADQSDQAAPPSFQHDILPLLTRFGCNQGACHGKQAGQNGFRLSLRGYAPEWDHEWITREFLGRRINRNVPDDSLLLRKALGEVPHGGGRLFARDSRPHRTLLAWIEAGTPALSEDEPPLDRIEVSPGDRTLRPGQTQQLAVRARFADGSTRDVTWLSQFFSNDLSVVDVSADGRIEAAHAGETAVRIHYQDQVETVLCTVPHETRVDSELYRARNNLIDGHVYDKLASLNIPPSPLCDDATFLRRAFLDTIGTLPESDEVRAFLADDRTDKRSRLIDDLLERPEFIDYWTLQLADLFQNRKERDHDVRGTKGVRSFHAWLRQQVTANRPWDELARDVLTATGDSVANPQIGYYIVAMGNKRQPEESEVVASVAQAFLGTRIGCAQCHNHPLEKYTQDDYYHFAAFFARMSFDRRKPDEGPTVLLLASQQEQQLQRQIEQTETRIGELEAELAQKEGQEAEQPRKQLEGQRRQLEERRRQLDEHRQKTPTVRQPRTNAMLSPRPLDRSEFALEPGSDPRRALADWITDPANESFSGNMVNRLWRHFLGVGLVEPVDDLRASNPPSNPELWKALNREFVSGGFDLKHVMRLILNSRIYQLSSSTVAGNETDERFYSHYYARRLPAEVILDAVAQSTGVPDRFPGYPVGLRAVQLPDPGVNSYFLSLFGRSERITACACERSGEVTLPQLLHLQNGDTVLDKLRSGDGRLAALLKASGDDVDRTVEELFLATLTRLPTDAERQIVLDAVSTADNRPEALRDVFWTLLNTKEFAFNH